MLLSTSETALSLVVCDATKVDTRVASSLSCGCMLKGCDPSSWAPRFARSAPVICSVPMATVRPTPTLPSWQLRHRWLAGPTLAGVEGVAVELGYRMYSLVERVWFQSGASDSALCGAW